MGSSASSHGPGTPGRVAADGRTPNRSEVDLGLRYRRSSDRMIDGGSAQGSEYQNHAALPQRGRQKLGPRQHAVMVLDRAGWHTAKQLNWPRRITPLFLPPYSPELNPAERLWLWSRERHWSNRVYPDEQSLFREAKRSHRQLRRAQSPFNMRYAMGHARGSSMTLIRGDALGLYLDTAALPQRIQRIRESPVNGFSATMSS